MTTQTDNYELQILAWELTRRCGLVCKHCRAGAENTAYENELSTEQCTRLLDNVAGFAKPIVILTGGEPLLRKDIFEIARYGSRQGLRMVLATCGVGLDDDLAEKISESGIKTISFSIDGANAQSHDDFRGVSGAYDQVIKAIEVVKRYNIEFQINTTITADNLDELPAIMNLTIDLGAKTFNPFLLVPTGRGKQLADQQISAQQYEHTLQWLAQRRNNSSIQLRVTCAPHYQRIIRQERAKENESGSAINAAKHPHQLTGGCLGGKQFAFVSHTGQVQICGFLDESAGNLRQCDFDLESIWKTSNLFRQVRDVDHYKGKCGFCEYRRLCGGCRARAGAMTGDYLASEPFCMYQPKSIGGGRTMMNALTPRQKQILQIIQNQFPIEIQPYRKIAQQINSSENDIIRELDQLKQVGIIRRIGPFFDARRLGYVSTLVAAEVPDDRLEAFIKQVNALPGVSHNYGRNHPLNVWFTLTVPNEERIDQILESLRGKYDLQKLYNLPAVRMFKLKVHFSMDSSNTADEFNPQDNDLVEVLSPQQKSLIRLLQQDISLESDPYSTIAKSINQPVDDVLNQINDWLDRGVIRRFGAAVRHQRLGFTFNTMAVFKVQPDRIETAAQIVSQSSHISHCYQRKTEPNWPYNLYAMVHSPNEDQMQAITEDLICRIQQIQFELLPTLVEYKKSTVQFFTED